MIKCQTLIIGGGAAGMNAALNIENGDVLLIEKEGSNSLLSPWNIMIKPKEVLKEKILKTGKGMSDPVLLKVFLEDYRQAVNDLKKKGIKFRNSNIGLVPDYSLPGLEVKRILTEKSKQRGVNLLKGDVSNFLINEAKKIIGVKVRSFNKRKETTVFFNNLILAAGGMGGFFTFKTGGNGSDGSILSLCYEAGLKMRDIEFFMFHPFLIVDKRLPNLLISGDILTKMEYEDEKGESFLSKKVTEALKKNEHHYIFDEMTKEFYLQSLKGKIFGRLICSEAWFEDYKKKNEFGFILKNFTKDKLKKIKFHPAFHFSIGGLAINRNGRTSQNNVYAAGEITGGLYGSNRIGGLAVLDALIFGKRAAEEINNKKKKETKNKKIEEIGDLSLSDKRKRGVWEALGPIRKKTKLKKLQREIKNKKTPSSQEKLIERIVEISLQRKESVGTFFREDLPLKENAKNSFLTDKKIHFK